MEAVKFLDTVDPANELIKYSLDIYRRPVKPTAASMNIMTWWETGSHVFIPSLQLLRTTPVNWDLIQNTQKSIEMLSLK